MNRSHQSFLQQNGSTLLEKEAEICGFKTYQFRSSNGYGKTSIFELGSRATISFSDHLYYNDFEYAVLSEDSVVIHQYDSILTDTVSVSGKFIQGCNILSVPQKMRCSDI